MCKERDFLFNWLVDEIVRHDQMTKEEVEVFVRLQLKNATKTSIRVRANVRPSKT